MLLKVNAFNSSSTSGWDNLQLTTVGQITAALNDYESGSAVATNIRLEVVTAYAGASSSSALTASDHHGWEENVWDNFHFVSAATTTEWFIEGEDLTIGSEYLVRIAGAATQGDRDATFTVNGASLLYDNTAQATPITPTAPVEITATAQDNGSGVARLTFTATGNASFHYLTAFTVGDVAPTGPTITNINTNNQVTPGATATLTGTNLTNATGLNIGSVSQEGFTVVNDTIVTFTGTRGGNPYNQDLTATLLSPDGDATITVQQVPEAGTFAVTAASPNTTDDASLWANTVDTSTGDPVTVVNGDQFWVNSTIPGLAIDPTGAITANETGTFTGQFWRASEGLWGSDQTVSFTLPEVVTSVFSRKLRRSNKSALNKSLRTKL